MNKHIVAIGGGEIRQLKTLAIDKKIVSLSGKKHPRLLFIPTASSDSKNYVQAIEKVYGKKLGCKTDSLLLLREKPNKKEIEGKILSADIIYIGGGNTLKMMKLWRLLGVNKLLKSAYNNGTILCGISAGAICWFEYGHSDSMSFYNPNDWNYIRVKGLGLLKGLLCPHFDGQTRGTKRKKSFSQMIKKMGGLGIAIDNQAAIIFCNDSFRVIHSKKDSKAYKLFKKDEKIISIQIKPQKEFSPLKKLYSKTI
jgi:dipeptidase E